MLQSLKIENIAVVEAAELEFQQGFHVLTGETGAGKSIIIDSIYAILGERTSKELVRRGCKQASVTACFCDISPQISEKLAQFGIQTEAGEELILSRTITSDGHSKVRVNMQPASVTLLKEIGKLLINIHGQFDNQNLLNPERHIDFVDSFAQNGSLLTAYRSSFDRLRSINKELNHLLTSDAEARKRYELLKYQIEEITAAKVQPGEMDKLREYLHLQQNSQRFNGALQAALLKITGNDAEELSGASDHLTAAAKDLEGIIADDAKVSPLHERLTSLIYDLEDISALLSEQLEQNEYNPTAQEAAAERLELLKELTAKYGGTEQTCLDYLNAANRELLQIRQSSERQFTLQNELEQAEQALIAAGKKLTASRQQALQLICKKISAELEYLDFKAAVFTADFKQGRYTKNGCDTLEFLISANAGEVPKPLAKVASGGELSRVMLAIRCVLSKADDVQTLVFDEIDTGISGQAAVKVAKKLHEVSQWRQVICVTHLAQLAAAADSHLLIEKSVRDGRTYTAVTPIAGEARVQEIARIMAGDRNSDTILASARELLNNNF